MANNRIQFKRTSTSGLLPNTTNSANSSYIAAGEFAINLTDKKVVSSNGSATFEVGSNVSNITITGSLTANGSTGAAGQVLSSNGTGIYWADSTGSATVQFNTYTYSIAANTTVISGLDDNSQTLTYTSNLESVYVNGVKIIGGVDYSTTNASAITLTSNVISGDVVQIVAARSVTNIIGQQNVKVANTAANTIVDSFDKSIYRTAKYLIQIQANSQYHSTEVLLMHDNTTPYLTEYATIYSNNNLGTVSANVNAANVDLIVSPLYANSKITTVRVTLEA